MIAERSIIKTKAIFEKRVLTGSMDQLYRDVLLEHREAIIKSADPHDVLLKRLIDHLRSKKCLNEDQEQIIRSKIVSRDRIVCLLHFLSTEGQGAFEELCNSLEAFGTADKEELADLLRTSLRMKGRSNHESPSSKPQCSYKADC
jgi:hypothetical protein